MTLVLSLGGATRTHDWCMWHHQFILLLSVQAGVIKPIMPLPGLSLWPGRQPYRSRIVDGRRGGGQPSVAPRSRNPPTGRRRDSPISSLFLHGPPLYAVGYELANRASPLQNQPAKTRPPPVDVMIGPICLNESNTN